MDNKRLVETRLKSVSKWKLLFNNYYKTLSGHFFAICIFIFHKTEVQTVIFRCLTGQNLNWFNSYGLRWSRRPPASSVNFKKIATDKWLFYNHIRSFLANYMFIFHKTEIQMVILRCSRSLNINWYKSYDINGRTVKKQNLCFCTKSQKKGNGNTCILLHLRP